MSFHLLFSTQNKCSLCFNSHVFLSPSPTASASLKKIITKPMYFFHQLAAINIMKLESCTSIIHSHTCIVMHACRKQSKWNKILISLHMNITSHYPYTNFICARSTHIFSASLKINNHFDLILMSFLSPFLTTNAPLKINWFLCFSFSLPYIKCSAQNKLSQRQQNGSSWSRNIRLSNSLIKMILHYKFLNLTKIIRAFLH